MHRIGGIEKEDGTGNISYDPENHEQHGAAPRREGRRHRQRHPARSRSTSDDGAEVLVLGWGGTWGAIDAAVRRRPRRAARRSRTRTSCTSTRSRANLGEVLRRYRKVLVPEMNLGQLSRLVRAEFLVDAQSLTQGAGRAVPRRPRSRAKILEMIDE